MTNFSLPDSLELRFNNPFSRGSQFLYEDGTIELDGPELVFVQSERDRYYTVEKDDELFSIADQAYDDSKLYWIIQLANDMEWAFDLQIGQVLWIPDLDNFKATS